MKKIIKKLSVIALGLTALIFSSCFNNVYYEIMRDVSPTDATVSGSITAITRYTVDGVEFLTLSGNNPDDKTQCGLRYKKADANKEGQWHTFPVDSLPFALHHYDYYDVQNHVGEQIVKVISDKSNIYLITIEYENNKEEGTTCPKKCHIWQTQMSLNESDEWVAGDWTDLCETEDYLPVYIYDDYCYSAFSVFGTNSVNPDHRSAYIRKGSASANLEDYQTVTVYKLNGADAPEEITPTIIEPEEDADNNVQSAVYFGGEVLFFNSLASATNETMDTDATRFYFATTSDDGILYYSDENDTTYNDAGIEAGEVIISMAINSDCIILGKGNLYNTTSSSSGGVEKVEIDESGKPASELAAFTTNIESKLQSNYMITCLLSVDPTKSELENSIYAAISFVGTGTSTTASFKELGLWAYYADRGNWNRE